jgi:hypothetical protein
MHLLEGADGDHVAGCIDCLRTAVTGELFNRLRQQRDEVAPGPGTCG